MPVHAAKITREGQVTIQHFDQSQDWSAGYLRRYTNGEYLTPEQIREIAAQSIAEQILKEMDETAR
jgi:hypothetical protein